MRDGSVGERVGASQKAASNRVHPRDQISTASVISQSEGT